MDEGQIGHQRGTESAGGSQTEEGVYPHEGHGAVSVGEPVDAEVEYAPTLGEELPDVDALLGEEEFGTPKPETIRGAKPEVGSQKHE